MKTTLKQPYVDAGMALTFRLCRSLHLSDWNEGFPNYTQEEVAAIERSLSRFQKMANREMGGEAMFHPSAAPEIQRMVAGEALADLASSRCSLSGEIPSNWRAIASTYLKAWASLLEPRTLIQLGDLLANAGRQNEAREVYKVVLFFPTYAETLWGKEDPQLLKNIVDEATEALRSLGRVESSETACKGCGAMKLDAPDIQCPKCNLTPDEVMYLRMRGTPSLTTLILLVICFWLYRFWAVGWPAWAGNLRVAAMAAGGLGFTGLLFGPLYSFGIWRRKTAFVILLVSGLAFIVLQAF